MPTSSSELEYLGSRPWAHKGGLIEFKKFQYEQILELVSRFGPPPRRLLDIGCNWGGLLEIARDRGYQVVGYDLLGDAIESLRNRSLECYLASTIAEFKEQRDCRFGVVTCVDVHYYFEDQEKELSGMLTLLEEDGIVLMRCRTMNWLVLVGHRLSSLMPGAGNWVVKKALRDYQFSMSANKLIELIEKVGGEVLYAAPKGGLPSKKSAVFVKLWFSLSNFVWKLAKKDISIGFIIIFKRATKRQVASCDEGNLEL